MTMVETHLAYLAISITVTVWVARTLQKHGLIYLSDRMADKPELVESFSHLLIVGFYLVTLGFESLFLRFGDHVTSLEEGIELLSTKIGFVLIVLGVMHFISMAVFSKSRWQTMRPPTT